MLTIRRTKVFHGPSIWAPVPVILLDIDVGPLEERLRRETLAFFDRLIALVPPLSAYGGVVSQPEGGLRRLLLDRLALALQTKAGATVTFAQTHPTAERGVYSVVYQYQQEDVGAAAGPLAVRLLNHLLFRDEPDFDFAHQCEALLVKPARRAAYDIDTRTIVAAAERRGIPMVRLQRKPTIIQFGDGVYQRRLSGRDTSYTGTIAVSIAKDKALTNRLLDEACLPAPRGATVSSPDDAVAAARHMGYPVVLKPLDGNRGRGVCVDLGTEAEVREFYPIAARETRSGSVVVESHLSGKDYRVLVVNNQVVAVAERVPAHVIGNGALTVRQLIERTNEDPLRNTPYILSKIAINEQTVEALAKQRLALDDIPKEGQFVQLKLTANVSTGGTKIDRSDEIHPDNAAIARQAAMVVGLDIAGVDLITPDIARSFRESGGGIVEVNSRPGLTVHTHPTEGPPRDVGMAIVNMLFPPGQPVRVPIVAITGATGTTTTTCMIAHILSTAGKNVGMATADGLYVDGMQLLRGDRAGPASARKVLRNAAVDHAVLETGRGGILRDGLGFDRCDVAVVTTVSADHRKHDAVATIEARARVEAVVTQSVAHDGASVLNADDPDTVALAQTAGGRIMYFSLEEENPVIRAHLRAGGRGIVLRASSAGQMLTLQEATAETPLLLAEEIPATLGGRVRVNIQNALAATAAAIAQEAPLDVIRNALRTFTSTTFQSPGRFNLLSIDGRTVLLDSGSNLAALEAIADVVKRMGAERKVAMIGVPGDRSDEDIEKFGALAARTFDELVIRGDARRGRKRGEVPALLRASAIATGLTQEQIHVVLDEHQAADEAIAIGGENGLVVLIVDTATDVWNHLATGRAVESIV